MKLMTSRTFRAFDRSNDGLIDCNELMAGLRPCSVFKLVFSHKHRKKLLLPITLCRYNFAKLMMCSDMILGALAVACLQAIR